MASERDCVNKLLENSGSPLLNLPELVTLGFLVARKWDRAREDHAAEDYDVDPSEVARYDRFTTAELREYRESATRMLAEFAAASPRTGDSWWRGFWQGFASAWAYALSIAVVALIIKLSGSDLLTLLRDLFASTSKG